MVKILEEASLEIRPQPPSIALGIAANTVNFTLALGIGAINTAIFSAVDAVKPKPLPYEGAE